MTAIEIVKIKGKRIIDWRIILISIIALCIIEVVALCHGINGILMGGVVASISGLAGWTIPQLKTKE